jgi:hypothetical protein
MIGGFDIELLGRTSAEDIDLALRALRAVWPVGVVENGDGDLVMPLKGAAGRTWRIPCELFVYADHTSYASWTELGLTDENAAEMIAITVTPDGIFFVVNEPRSASHLLATHLIDAIRNHRATFRQRAA